MFSDIIVTAQTGLYSKRIKLINNTNSSNMMEKCIKVLDKIEACNLLYYTLETSITTSSIIYQLVITNEMSFRDACIKAKVI